MLKEISDPNCTRKDQANETCTTFIILPSSFSFFYKIRVELVEKNLSSHQLD